MYTFCFSSWWYSSWFTRQPSSLEIQFQVCKLVGSRSHSSALLGHSKKNDCRGLRRRGEMARRGDRRRSTQRILPPSRTGICISFLFRNLIHSLFQFSLYRIQLNRRMTIISETPSNTQRWCYRSFELLASHLTNIMNSVNSSNFFTSFIHAVILDSILHFDFLLLVLKIWEPSTSSGGSRSSSKTKPDTVLPLLISMSLFSTLEIYCLDCKCFFPCNEHQSMFVF